MAENYTLATRLELANRQRKYFVDIRDFGAVGDGVTDDTVAIQAAVSSLLPGHCLMIPPGDYLTTAVIGCDDKEDITLLGTGGRLMFDRTTAAQHKGAVLIFRRCDNIVLEGLRITDPVIFPRDGFEASRQGIKLLDTTNFTLTKNVIKGASGYGIQVYRSSHGVIAKNRITDTGIDGCQMTHGASYISVTGNYVRRNDDDCISVISYNNELQCHRITITGNNVGTTRGHGINVSGSRHCSINSNVVDMSFASGINASHNTVYALQKVSDISIVGNIVTNSGQHDPLAAGSPVMGSIHVGASAVDGCNTVLISNNTITDAKHFGIFSIGTATGQISDVRITSNNITGGLNDGIVAMHTNDLTVENNTVKSVGNNGLWIKNDYGVVRIQDNNVTNPGTNKTEADVVRGIFIDCPSADVVRVVDNDVRDRRTTRIADQDIEIINTPNTLVRDNTVSKPLRFMSRDTGKASSAYSGLTVGWDKSSALAGGAGGIGIRDSATLPTGTPESGGYIYVEAGVLKYVGSAGNTTIIAQA